MVTFDLYQSDCKINPKSSILSGGSFPLYTFTLKHATLFSVCINDVHFGKTEEKEKIHSKNFGWGTWQRDTTGMCLIQQIQLELTKPERAIWIVSKSVSATVLV